MENNEASAWVQALCVSHADFLAKKYGKLYSWQDVPVYWFLWATEANLLEWEKGEKQKRVNAARIEAESEGVNDIEARARIIQRKRVVWDKLVNPPQK